MPGPPEGADAYYSGLNEWLLRAVPPTARTIVEVGCGYGKLGTRLKELRPGSRVYGVERVPAAAKVARTTLDDVFECDVEQEDLPLEDGSVDCILYGDVLEHMRDPWAVLRRHRRLLHEGGIVLCSIPNVQHHSVVSQLLQGDFQYQDAGIMDWTHLRFFTCASAMKMLLDSGYAPDLVDEIPWGGAEGLVEAGADLFRALRVDLGRATGYLNTQQMIISGAPLPDPGPGEEVPLTIVACVNDEGQLSNNLLRSPALRGSHPHEVLLYRGCQSAAEGLNAGIEQARHDLVVLVHQDVYLPEGWTSRLVQQWRAAFPDPGRAGVAGVWGLDSSSAEGGFFGHVLDRDHLLRRGPLPRRVDMLDELCMVVPRRTPLRFDPAVSWHLYGTDLCLSAREAGLEVAVLDAVCHHNSLTASLDPAYRRSEEVIARKWVARLPVATICSVIDGVPSRQEVAELEERVATLDEERRAAQLQCQELGARIASMEASPFWKARRLYAAARSRRRPSVSRPAPRADGPPP